MDRVTVTAGLKDCIRTLRTRLEKTTDASVYADIDPFLLREPGQDAIVELDEGVKKLCTGPRVARVLLCGQPALGEVDRDSLGPRREAAADVLLTLVASSLRHQPSEMPGQVDI